jgi:hypothetical protein
MSMLSNRSLIKGGLIVMISICTAVGLAAPGQTNPVAESGIQSFAQRELKGGAAVLAFKQSQKADLTGGFWVAVLCRSDAAKTALLIGESHGQEIKRVWSSSNAKDLPGVLSFKNLNYAEFDGDQFFSLWGCHPHDCGGLDGVYTFDIFQVSTKKMMIFDVRQCELPAIRPKVATKGLCITDVKNPDSTPGKSVQHALTDAIKSAIPSASDVPIDF